MNQLILDASKATLGRVASFAAKQALMGKHLIILNCNNVVVTGSRSNIIEEYKRIRSLGGSAMKGPFFPKSPDRIMKRTIRGMLPYKQYRGRMALKNIICYNSIPKEYENAKKITFKIHEKRVKTMTLEEISKLI